MTGTRGEARRSQVLRARGDFEALLRSGARLVTPNFVLRSGHSEAGHPRLGIIAARKIATRAVDRNRARRLIREVFRQAIARLGACDVLVQLRSDLRASDNAAVRAELEQLFEGVIRRRPTTRTAPIRAQ